MKVHKRSLESGFTLIEASIYIAVLAVVGMSLVSVALASTRSTTEHDTVAKVAERNRTALVRIERELRNSMAGTTVIDGLGKTLTFVSVAGFDGTSAASGETVVFALELAAEEALNGVDDDGDGLADEGQLRRRGSGGDDHLVCSGIDLRNSGFTVSGTGVSVRITTCGSMRNGSPFTLSKTVNVYPRN